MVVAIAIDSFNLLFMINTLIVKYLRSLYHIVRKFLDTGNVGDHYRCPQKSRLNTT